MNIFANVIAHEIGHNLASAMPRGPMCPPGRRMANMLAGHTWRERRTEQRNLVEQDTCPDAAHAKASPPISMPLSLPPG